MKNVALLGATGSIGTSTIGVLKQHPERFKLYAVAANRNWKQVAQIAREMDVERFCMFEPEAAKALSKELGKPVLTGMDGLCESEDRHRFELFDGFRRLPPDTFRHSRIQAHRSCQQGNIGDGGRSDYCRSQGEPEGLPDSGRF